MGLGDGVFIVSFLGLLSGLAIYVYTRVKRPQGFKKIPREIQAEIDVTPEWWDAQFRKLQGLPPLRETTFGDFRRWVDPKPPTIDEIWTPTQGSSYDLSVDLAAMMSALEEAKTNDR